tara:strand:- start:358 stop:1362 length:1005 start_codon:yes stop_codon:yes gene_type:complete
MRKTHGMKGKVKEMDVLANENRTASSLEGKKFRFPLVTASGQERAKVTLNRLRTLWFNTGSLCNITCVNCYMGSSPTNDHLEYLSLNDVKRYLDEVENEGYILEEVAFTGGEPLMNNALPDMMTEALERGYKVLLLTNAMKPLHHKKKHLMNINRHNSKALTIRVSLDHFTQEGHESMRGRDTWNTVMGGLHWLTKNNFNVTIAGRACWSESEVQARQGYANLFKREGFAVDAYDPAHLVLFPEMDLAVDVPEISVECWDILGVNPESLMCATSRMVVKKKGAEAPTVMPCTLLPYDSKFDMGIKLSESIHPVRLNHPYCAKFCVLGGASCTHG